MEATYRALSPAAFAKLLADRETGDPVSYILATLPYPLPYPPPSPLESFEQRADREEQQEVAGQLFDLGKEWHTLHYLLTGESSLEEPSQAPPPLGNVVRGGTPTPFQAIGPVRSLNPDEVRAVADALRHISPEELGRRFDAAAREAPKIYSQRWGEDEREWLLELYVRLTTFFNKVAAAGDMLLLSID
jgi:hypothetical protein